MGDTLHELYTKPTRPLCGRLFLVKTPRPKSGPVEANTLTFQATYPHSSGTDDLRRQNALSVLLALCLGVAFVVRFVVTPELLNRVVDYTGDSGAFYEKLHFGTYAIALLAPLVLFSRPFVLRGDEIAKFRWLLRYTFWLLAMAVLLVFTGRSGPAGFLIDTYLVAALAGLAMLGLSENFRRRLGDLTLGLLVLSAAIAIVEAITKHRLLPYDAVELTFRPLGLSEHPLVLGAMCATGIGFVPLTRWRVWAKVGMVVLLFVGCAASGARFALLAAGAEIVLMLVALPWPGLTRRHARQAKAAVLLFTFVGGPLLVAGLGSAGLLDRFSSSLVDDNFMVRVTIYRVFDYTSWNDILFGMQPDDLLAIVHGKLHLPTIESAPVVILLLLGLPLALLFTALLIWTLRRLLKGGPMAAWIGTLAFLAAALSNNTLSSKTPVVAMVVVLLVAYAIPKARRAPAEAH